MSSRDIETTFGPWRYEVQEVHGSCDSCGHGCVAYEVIGVQPSRFGTTVRYSRRFLRKESAEAHMHDVQKGWCEL